MGVGCYYKSNFVELWEASRVARTKGKHSSTVESLSVTIKTGCQDYVIHFCSLAPEMLWLIIAYEHFSLSTLLLSTP